MSLSVLAAAIPALKRPLLASAQGLLRKWTWSESGDACLRTGLRSARYFSALPSHVVLTMPSLSPTMTQGNLVKWHVKEEEKVLTMPSLSPTMTQGNLVLTMPSLSPTMTQGNLVKWYVKEGEEVTAGTVLADVETDKATLAYENQEEGFIAKIMVADNTRDIPIGTPVALLVESKEDIPAFANWTGAVSAEAEGDAPATAPAPAAGKQYPPHQGLPMPALSPTMEVGNIVTWKVKVGDELKPGDLLADIETDKATMSFENQDDGFLAKIVYPDGAKDIPINTVIAIIVEEKELIAAFADYVSPSPSSEAAAAASADAPASASTPAPAPAKPATPANHRMGPAARNLMAVSGLSASDITPTGPNAIITKGDVLAAIAAGPNAIITKGDVLAAIAAGVKPGAATNSPAAPQAKPVAAPAAAPTASAPKATPAPRATPPPAAAPAAGTYVDIPKTQMRRIIAKRLLDSKNSIPGLYVSVDANLDALASLRASLLDTLASLGASLQDKGTKGIAAGAVVVGGGGAIDANLDALASLRVSLLAKGTKVSVNDFVLKAVAAALREVPEANVYWDDTAQEVKSYSSVDICVAVATEGGLMTPIVKDAADKTLQQISKDVKSLALKARENKLKPEEFTGGSFTVSNLGMFGISSFTAIINPPQAGILAVGGSQQRVLLGADGQLTSQSFMTLSLSADHRVYDGALASAFLKSLKANLESPEGLITGFPNGRLERSSHWAARAYAVRDWSPKKVPGRVRVRVSGIQAALVLKFK
eukprot:gene28174-31271_t